MEENDLIINTNNNIEKPAIIETSEPSSRNNTDIKIIYKE